MTTPRAILGELALVLLTGVGLGLGANALNPDGLDLGRDYFPTGAAATSGVTPPDASGDTSQTDAPADGDSSSEPDGSTGTSTGTDMDTDAGSGTEADTESDPGSATDAGAEADPAVVDGGLPPAVVERLAAKGLTAATHDEVVSLFQDPMYAYEAYVFIDARDDAHYTAGHIPGAYQFDHFRAERYQDQMMQILPTSMEVVVYCNGGDCEDSESAALFLLSLGADPAHLRVYAGGIAEWQAKGLDVETGERLSGQIEGSSDD